MHLLAEGITKRYGGVSALTNGCLDVRSGEVHVLIGSNGCGKSTLCKVISGAVAPDSGELRIGGTPVDIASPADARRAGVGMFYQESSLVAQLSVADNISLGMEPRRGGLLVDRQEVARRAEKLLLRFGAAAQGIRPDTAVADLAADQRQLVEIMKLMARDPRIIIFDEPTSSLDARQVGVFFEIVRELKSAGRAIVFISHRMDEVFAIADRVTVMRNGARVATLEIAGTSREQILQLMVGDERVAAAPRSDTAAANTPTDSTSRPVLLRARSLSSARIHDVSFDLRAGEVLGLGGLHGQGQSALLKLLFGAERRLGGDVQLSDAPLRARSPHEAMRSGVAYISGDRARSGAFGVRSIFENLAAATLSKQRDPLVHRTRLLTRLAPLVQRLELKLSGYEAPLSELSGGNQQKVLIGRWLAAEPLLLLLDDPTKGIDLQAKRDLYALIRELAAQGLGIILFSSEDDELLSNVDRILVFNSGRIAAELSGASMTPRNLYHAAYRMDAAS